MDLIILVFCVTVLVILYGIYKNVRPSKEEKEAKIQQRVEEIRLQVEKSAVDKQDISRKNQEYNRILDYYYRRLFNEWIEEHGEDNLTDKVKAKLLKKAHRKTHDKALKEESKSRYKEEQKYLPWYLRDK